MELTVYPDGHAGIAVSRIEGSPPSRRISQADSLPLNHVEELREHVLAVIERLEDEAARLHLGGPSLPGARRTESAPYFRDSVSVKPTAFAARSSTRTLGPRPLPDA